MPPRHEVCVMHVHAFLGTVDANAAIHYKSPSSKKMMQLSPAGNADMQTISLHVLGLVRGAVM